MGGYTDILVKKRVVPRVWDAFEEVWRIWHGPCSYSGRRQQEEGLPER